MKMDDYPILLTIQQASRKIGKSEKTLRRWIQSGKLKAEKHGPGGYLIKREDLDAVTNLVTKQWRGDAEMAEQSMKILMLETAVEEMQYQIRDLQHTISELQAQVKKLTPKKPTTKKKATTTRTRTTRRKADDPDWW